jgi:hypothetical protein
MKEIQLSQGKVALVDDEDFEAIAAHKWSAHRQRNTFYAHRSVRRHGGGWTQETMHRVILARKLGRPIADAMLTDHGNGDGLDNRRKNLDEVTTAQNLRNCSRRVKNPSSQYLGITLDRAKRKWRAQIMVAGKQHYLGIHATELAAAQARETFINTHPELNARSNFPSAGETP